MYNTCQLQVFALTCYIFLIYTFLLKARLLYLSYITFLKAIFCAVYLLDLLNLVSLP